MSAAPRRSALPLPRAYAAGPPHSSMPGSTQRSTASARTARRYLYGVAGLQAHLAGPGSFERGGRGAGQAGGARSSARGSARGEGAAPPPSAAQWIGSGRPQPPRAPRLLRSAAHCGRGGSALQSTAGGRRGTALLWSSLLSSGPVRPCWGKGRQELLLPQSRGAEGFRGWADGRTRPCHWPHPTPGLKCHLWGCCGVWVRRGSRPVCSHRSGFPEPDYR